VARTPAQREVVEVAHEGVLGELRAAERHLVGRRAHRHGLHAHLGRREALVRVVAGRAEDGATGELVTDLASVRLARDQVAEERAGREDVDAHVTAVGAPTNLGREVRREGHRQLGGPRVEELRAVEAAELHDLSISLGDDDEAVGRERAHDDAVGVERTERRQRLHDEARRAIDLHRLLRHELSDGRAVERLEHDVGAPVLDAAVDHALDVRARRGAERAGLALEQPLRQTVEVRAWRQHAELDRATDARVLGEEAHEVALAGEQPDHVVLPVDHARARLPRIVGVRGHGATLTRSVSGTGLPARCQHE
jgi:hypothetical protein